MRQGTIVDATLIAAPSSTKNSTGERDKEMVSGDASEPRTAKKGNQWHFVRIRACQGLRLGTATGVASCAGRRPAGGMKAHVGVDADSGLVHTVVGTAANVNDVTQAHHLLHGKETDVFGDAGYQGADKREENQGKQLRWHIAMRPGKRKVPQDAVGRGQPGAGAPMVVGTARAKCVLNPAKPDKSGPRGLQRRQKSTAFHP